MSQNHLALPTENQIRLSSMSYYNWGSLHGQHHIQLDRKGTLITGINGAGKSTLIDGITTLLQSAGTARFNIAAAQDDKDDRNLAGYIRGTYGTETDATYGKRKKNKRPDSTLTALIGTFTADDSTQTALAALFWINGTSSNTADIKQLRLIYRRELTLAELLDGFDNTDPRKFKARHSANPDCLYCGDTFKDYQTHYRQRFQIENHNAEALLIRALGMKKIDDLTALLRSLVLESNDIRSRAKTIIDEFGDLRTTHHNLQDARSQQNQLATLPDQQTKLDTAIARLAELNAEENALPYYLARLETAAKQHELKDKNQELTKRQAEQAELSAAIKDLDSEIQRLHDQYLQHGGGQIEQLRERIAQLKTTHAACLNNLSQYQEHCRALNLDSTANRSTHQQNLAQLPEIQRKLEQQTNELNSQRDDIAHQIRSLQKEIQDLQTEIDDLKKRPESNIPADYQRQRDRLLSELNIAKERLPYLGELIDIKAGEQHWQGAIERALGGLRLTLLCEETDRAAITDWLNRNHTGLHMRLQVLRGNSNADFLSDGYLRKLEWKTHPYRDRLKTLLQHHDLHCVPDTATLNRTPHALTQAGLIHRDSGRYEKNDRHNLNNPRHWYIGFSNKRRLENLENDTAAKQQEQHRTVQQAKNLQNQIEAIAQQKQHLNAIENDWEQLDAARQEKLLHTAETELKNLENHALDAKTALQQKETRQQERQHKETAKDTLLKSIGKLEDEIHRLETRLNEIQTDAETPIAEDTLQRLSARSHPETSIRKDIDNQKDNKNAAQNSITAILANFRGKDQWKPLTSDWANGNDALPDALRLLEKLNSEALPKLENAFISLLNRQTTESITNLRQSINSELNTIQDKIDSINDVLKTVPFRQHSFLQIRCNKEPHKDIQDFETQLTSVLELATADIDSDSRYRQLNTFIETLSEHLNKDNKTSSRLLDPRYRYNFTAEEYDSRDTSRLLDELGSSSGKSGGEKESFAGIVMAASLAYVLTPAGASKPSYATVFLDEAFSNLSDATGKRVLKAFQALHLHLNLITPGGQKLDIARDSAGSLIMVERDKEQHESRLCHLSWARWEALYNAHAQAQAAQHGIHIEPQP